MIDSFTGKYSFLSNFYPVEVTYKGVTYPSSEHAFQAAKAINDQDRDIVRTASNPRMAKRLGRDIECRDDWEDVKFGIMFEIVKAKFLQNPVLRAKLLETGRQRLIEGNVWNDQYWGVCNGIGKNLLGQILMNVRKKCREVFGCLHH